MLLIEIISKSTNFCEGQVVRDAEPLEKNAYKIPLFRGMMEEELLRMAP